MPARGAAAIAEWLSTTTTRSSTLDAKRHCSDGSRRAYSVRSPSSSDASLSPPSPSPRGARRAAARRAAAGTGRVRGRGGRATYPPS
eukprot:140449-Chlamydomonas_euryale.AAC.11